MREKGGGAVASVRLARGTHVPRVWRRLRLAVGRSESEADTLEVT